MKTPLSIGLVALIAGLNMACNQNFEIKNGDLTLEINDNMYTRVNSVIRDSGLLSPDFTPSEYLLTSDGDIKNFRMDLKKSEDFTDNAGKGTLYVISGKYSNNDVEITKLITFRVYKDFKNIIFLNTRYVNSGKTKILVDGWVNNYYKIQNSQAKTPFWTFQGSSSGERADWILPVTEGFYQKNYMGMNNSDYGGGVPVTDIWRKDVGIAIGHTELVPKLVSLPVSWEKGDNFASIGVEYRYPKGYNLLPGDTLAAFETFVSVHKGDCFTTLREYSDYMQKKGISFVKPEDAAFESIWCAWGYERNFTIGEVLQTLPKVKELGIKWAVLDDGFQQAEGDWQVNLKKFPNGDKDIKRLVDEIHSYGLKAKLWWAPLAVDSGSNLLNQNPEILLKNEDGSPQFITWWDAYYMSPVYPKTIEHTKEVINMFMHDWDFDGLKLDGQHMNAVPPDYNPVHHLSDPLEAVEKLPDFFRTIYQTATSIKPNAVVENCPCGTCMSFYNMATTNQTVASDPESSWQIRLKGKVYKAIMPHNAYYGDHVELSDGGDDFASSFGIGAVLGTKFTWPKDNPTVRRKYLLTPEKEVTWKKWFGLYHQKMLSKAEYIGDLYDIGFDLPETHVITKGDTMFYAFYDKNWNGPVELRGLQSGTIYEVYDYVNDKNLGSVTSDNPQIISQFKNSLLIEVYPVE
ncbi:MAG: alpha-galactosidase [Bacteroidales bacterium]|nr:alpha-galactosidase [Bacteroidales bacterium]